MQLISIDIEHCQNRIPLVPSKQQQIPLWHYYCGIYTKTILP